MLWLFKQKNEEKTNIFFVDKKNVVPLWRK